MVQGFRSFLVMLVHEKKKVLYANLTPLLGVEKRSNNNKWTPHYQTEFDGESEKKITV